MKYLQHFPHVLGQAWTTQGSEHMPLLRPSSLWQPAVSMSEHLEFVDSVDIESRQYQTDNGKF